MIKSEIRKINKEIRTAMQPDEVKSKSIVAQKCFLQTEFYKNAQQIMLYFPLGNETDTSEIMKRAYKDSKRCIFPVTDSKTGEITACFADINTVFTKGAFSVFEPDKKQVADLKYIDVILVPGIAFDKKGSRVGFGKGCYDRFLKKCDALKIGFCYDFQVCENICNEEHDIKMDYLITEKRLIGCE